MNRDVNIPYDEGMGETNRMSDAQERLVGLGSRLKDRASHLTDTVSQTVDKQRENAARGLDRAASGLQEGMGSASKAAHNFADGMKSTASYLRTHTFADMGDEVISVCRRHPAQALISAALLGFVAGRLIRR